MSDLEQVPVRSDVQPDPPQKKSHALAIVAVIMGGLVLMSLIGLAASTATKNANDKYGQVVENVGDAGGNPIIEDETPTGAAALNIVLDENPGLVSQFCSSRESLLNLGFSDSDILSYPQVQRALEDMNEYGLTESESYYIIKSRC